MKIDNHQKIKKIFWFFLCMILVLGFCSTPQTKAYQEVRDQYFIGSGSTNDDLENLGNFPMTQSFVPTMDRLTKVRLEFSGSGTASNWTVSINNEAGSRLKEVKADIRDGWVTFTFDNPFNLTPGQTYKIEIQQCGFVELGAVYSDPGDYPKGNAETGTPIPTKDYHFESYGYSEVGSTNQDTEEEAIQSEEILSPSNLNAKAGSNKKSVELSWDISETKDISGYRIYRSETSGESYQKIGNVGEDTTKYTDRDVKQNKKHYYIVRTHIDDLESENSEEVSIILEEAEEEEQEERSFLIYWLILGGASLIVVVWYLIWAKKNHRWPFSLKISGIREI